MPSRSSYKVHGLPKWNVAEYKPPRKISDKELEMARKMFFDLDRDGSGSIDAEELGMMLRSLGQNPTDEELHALIDSVDDGDKDGQIQLREFLKLYTEGLDAKSKGMAGKEDVNNVFVAFGVRLVAALVPLAHCAQRSPPTLRCSMYSTGASLGYICTRAPHSELPLPPESRANLRRVTFVTRIARWTRRPW